MKIVNIGLKLGLLVCVGLLVIGCSTKETMSKEDRILSEKMKEAMFGTKEEFLLKVDKTGKILKEVYSTREKAYKARDKYINNSNLIPSDTTDPILIRILYQKKVLEYKQKQIQKCKYDFRNNSCHIQKNIFDFNAPKPDENKKYDDLGTQSIHQENIKWYQEYLLRRNISSKNSQDSIINELGKGNKKDNKMIKSLENLPDLTDEQQAITTELRIGLLMNEGRYIEVISLSKQVIKYYKNNFKEFNEISLGAYTFLYVSYHKLRLFKEAFNISEKLVFISQKNKIDKEHLSGMFHLHGISYLSLKNYNKAIEYFKKSLNSVADKRTLSRRYKDIADAYIQMGQKGKASFYLNESLKVK